MYQFFVEPDRIEAALSSPGKEIVLSGKDVNHIRNVLRMKEGEEIAVSDGVTAKEYRCMIENMTEREIGCRLLFIKEAEVELSAQVYLFQGLPKADKMEWIIQKAVELGVHEIIPVAAKRSVVKLDEKKSGLKINRWQGIAEAAAKQSRRRKMPVIKEVMSFPEAVSYAEDMDLKIIPYEMAENMSHTREWIGKTAAGQKVAVFIGPEGGFDEKEIRLASEKGVEPVTLGKRILRTETAGLVILSWIMYHLEP